MSKEFDLKKITTPILLHLLKDELAFPLLFIAQCKLTVNRFKKRIDRKFPKEFVDMTALPVWVYMKLKQKIGQRKAFEIMRVAILTGGVAKQSLLFETIARERTFQNFITQELEINRTGTTRWNTLEIVERTDSRFEIKITRCLFHELTCSLGIPELTPVICQVDNAVFNSYLPEEMIFHRGKDKRRIADGSSVCPFVWEFIKPKQTSSNG
ncbi:MAG TPA: L-2-amino-thiazoline-4-carboxylic acid hydrolase [Smithella sp.]|nr:L-2-amino-thiazoline-4-carboxylic acid hydrolase [Smithella sp.]MDM7988650.1 L-2-amino-thiazoline-4-carboxylic acid hydrolase [Smithella sp.]HNY50511.1 L-2-amino-thiazoline-4-carboxylic acid hydrolase [Smithella sp.]HOG90161.1 L-2-amino-thiazoline-4-carboxylic acid hydrolase [Smithella sp.]HOU51928.1 L-2-amino-thiazoline-4-carboxylic acid hydrolase [Smithella sp.]